MRFLAISIALASTAGLAAQNPYSLWPGETSFTSRAFLGVNAGSVYQGFHKAHHAGIGDRLDPASASCDCIIVGVTSVIQDQNDTTAEPYDIVVRTGTDALGPDPTAAGEIVRLPGALPVGIVGGPVAYLATDTFMTPVTIPCQDFFAVGYELFAAPGWSTDGMSVHASRGDQQGPGATGNIPSAMVTDIAWQIDAANVVSHPSVLRTWRIQVLTDACTMMVCNITDADADGTPEFRYGSGGLHPDNAATGADSQGLGYRIDCDTSPGATTFVLLGFGGFGPAPLPLSFAPDGGCLWLSLPTLYQAIAMGTEGTDNVIFPNGIDALVPTAGSGGVISLQGLVFDLAGPTIGLTNASTITLN